MPAYGQVNQNIDQSVDQMLDSFKSARTASQNNGVYNDVSIFSSDNNNQNQDMDISIFQNLFDE